jgi:hypothetical protein
MGIAQSSHFLYFSLSIRLFPHPIHRFFYEIRSPGSDFHNPAFAGRGHVKPNCPASHPSQWRKASDILDRVRNEMEPEPQHVTIRSTFGFFETSKYERQFWLRPAFIFALESNDRTEGQTPWQYTIVESATTLTEISLIEGLGSWASE